MKQCTICGNKLNQGNSFVEYSNEEIQAALCSPFDFPPDFRSQVDTSFNTPWWVPCYDYWDLWAKVMTGQPSERWTFCEVCAEVIRPHTGDTFNLNALQWNRTSRTPTEGVTCLSCGRREPQVFSVYLVTARDFEYDYRRDKTDGAGLSSFAGPMINERIGTLDYVHYYSFIPICFKVCSKCMSSDAVLGKSIGFSLIFGAIALALLWWQTHNGLIATAIAFGGTLILNAILIPLLRRRATRNGLTEEQQDASKKALRKSLKDRIEKLDQWTASDTEKKVNIEFKERISVTKLCAFTNEDIYRLSVSAKQGGIFHTIGRRPILDEIISKRRHRFEKEKNVNAPLCGGEEFINTIAEAEAHEITEFNASQEANALALAQIDCAYACEPNHGIKSFLLKSKDLSNSKSFLLVNCGTESAMQTRHEILNKNGLSRRLQEALPLAESDAIAPVPCQIDFGLPGMFPDANSNAEVCALLGAISGGQYQTIEMSASEGILQVMADWQAEEANALRRSGSVRTMELECGICGKVSLGASVQIHKIEAIDQSGEIVVAWRCPACGANTVS